MLPTSELDLPTERIEEGLVQCAIPGFYGEVSFEIYMMPTAALEVGIRQVRRTITQRDVVREEGPIIPSNERVSKVRAKLPELREKYCLLCPVKAIRAVFKDGHLIQFEITEVEQLRRPAIAQLPLAMKNR